jgi:hypothetical protein
MCPALWTTTSSRPVSAMTCLIAASTIASSVTSIASARRLTARARAYALSLAAARTSVPAGSRIPA